jgi:hypothetical protein
VGIGPEGEISFPEELSAQLTGRDFEECAVSFEEHSPLKEEAPEEDQEGGQEQSEIGQVARPKKIPEPPRRHRRDSA